MDTLHIRGKIPETESRYEEGYVLGAGLLIALTLPNSLAFFNFDIMQSLD
jgi:hypothetical protein